jgi:hypothetical protein
MKQFILLIIFILSYLRINAQILDKSLLEKTLNSIFSSYDDSISPGVAITILQNGKTFYKRHWGMANLEHNIPFSHNTPVRLGYSGTREFICVGLAIMELEGLLHFSDKVKDYFPKLPEWSNPVTIQDLLNHSSGFDDEWGTMLLMQASMYNRVEKEQLLTMLYNQPLPQIKPGEGYMYSNSDFALIRFIMEKASQMSLPKYLEERLFKPLGMSSTLMNDNLEQLIPGLADNYYGKSKYFKQRAVKTSPGGNYRMVTTCSDLERWAAALGDTTSIISAAFKLLYRNARPIPVLSPEIHYVFGHELEKIGNNNVIKHGGVNGDFYLARIPSQDIFIILLNNGSGNIITVMDLVNAILKKENQDIPKPPLFQEDPIQISNEEITNFTGRYFQLDRTGHSSAIPNIVFYDIKKEGEQLHFYYNINESFAMIPVGKNLFKDPEFGDIIEFSKSHSDSTTKMQVWLSDGRKLNFEKFKGPYNYSPERLKMFTGEYFSEHLDYYCRVLLTENNELVIRRPTISDKLLIPYGENSFLFEMQADSDGWYVLAEFTKNKMGEIDGINMQHQRMMHHRFEKVK